MAQAASRISGHAIRSRKAMRESCRRRREFSSAAAKSVKHARQAGALLSFLRLGLALLGRLAGSFFFLCGPSVREDALPLRFPFLHGKPVQQRVQRIGWPFLDVFTDAFAGVRVLPQRPRREQYDSATY